MPRRNHPVHTPSPGDPQETRRAAPSVSWPPGGRSSARSEIIHAAARLIAEDGLDYGFAKRKAVRQLGLPDSFPLPGNAEIETAVREYQAIYQEDEQAERIAFLRGGAIDLMHRLAAFSPYLTGSVLDGTAGRHARIDILLFPDSAKELEIFLLDQGIPFHHGNPRNERIEAVFVIDDESRPANLIVLPRQDERVAQKSHDGRTKGRAKVAAVEALCAAAG